MEVPESTKTHTCQTEADRAGTIYFVRRKFCFLWRDVRNFGPCYGTTSDYKGRIGPVVGIGLPVGYTLVVSPTYKPQHKMNCAPSEDSDQPVWSEYSQCVQWVVEDPMFLHVDSEGSDQTVRMSRLIWVFAGRRGHFVGLVERRLIYIYWEKNEPCSKKVLNSVSMQCARGKSSVARKSEVGTNFFKWGGGGKRLKM